MLQVEELLRDHPLGELDEDGEPFWGRGRLIPAALHLDALQPEAMSYVTSFVVVGAQLKAKALGLFLRSEDISQAAEDLLRNLNDTIAFDKVKRSLRDLISISKASPESCTQCTLASPLEFDKDDRTSGIVDWVAAASNLRCLVYGMRPVGLLEVQRVAGRIVPAIATTTALVAGLICLELPKIVMSASMDEEQLLGRLRNGYVNLALPMIAFTQPGDLPCEKCYFSNE